VTTDGGASFQPASGLPTPYRERFMHDQPLAADLAAPGVFYYFDASSGQLLVSSDKGGSFAPAKSRLPSVNGRYTICVVRSQPGAAREVWVAQQYAGLWR
jgi:hypothetical protein